MKKLSLIKTITLLSLVVFMRVSFASSNNSIVHTSALSLGVEYYLRIDAGALLNYKYTCKLPMYVGKNILTKSNSFSIGAKAEITPVTIELNGSITITPLSFLAFSAGGSVGSGWNLGSFVGIGYNEFGVRKGVSFGDVYLSDWFDVALQFETKGIFNNQWANILLFAKPRIQYQKLATVKSDTIAWIYQDDNGQNMNGFRLLQTYFVGYEMPWSVNLKTTAGCLLELKQELTHAQDNPHNEVGWASDFVDGRFGPVVAINYKNIWKITTVFQWRRERSYINGTNEETKNSPYFKSRIYNSPVTVPHRIQMSIERNFF